MSLGIVYNIFEGTELLEYSIREIRDSADFILLNYQKESYYHQPIKKEDLDRILDLQSRKVVDAVYCFSPLDYNSYIGNVPPTPYYAKVLERAKRELGRQIIWGKGLTYFLHMDVDEFYKKEEFNKAKSYIEHSDTYFSACSIKEYMKLPTYQLDYFEDIKVPFICKNGSHVSYKSGDFVTQVDPTRWYDSRKFKSVLFTPDQIVMHHMNNIRKNLQWKYQVTSRSNLDREKIPQLVNSILMMKEGMTAKGRKIIQVPNYFGIEGF